MSQSKSFIKGTIILSIAGILTRVISIFFRVPIVYLTGEDGMGYYQTFYPIFTLLVSIALVGMPQALSKMVSEKVTNKDESEVYAYFKAALMVLITIGALLTLFLYLGAGWLVKLMGWPADIIYVMYALAFSPIFIGIAGAIRGYFQGQQFMQPTAISQVIEGFTKVVFGIGLTYFLLKQGYDVPIAIAGAALGTSISYALSCLYLVYRWRRSTRNILKQKSNTKYIKKFTKSLLWMAIPITIGASAYSIMTSLDSVTLYHRLAVMGIDSEGAKLINGEIGKALTIINVPITLSVAIMVSTIPAVAEARGKKKKEELQLAMSNSTRLSLILALPSAIGLGILARPIMELIYPNDLGYEYLQLLSICLVFLVLGQALASILQGLGYVMLPIWALLISCVIKIIFNYFLIASPLLGKGAIIGSIAFYMTFCVFNYLALVRQLKIQVLNFDVVIKPLLSSIVMGIGVIFTFYMLTENMGVGISFSTLISIAIGGIIYVLFLFITQTIKEEELTILPKHHIIIPFLKKVKLLK
jgi:stage V sporulation protein B